MKQFPPIDENVSDAAYWKKWYELSRQYNEQLLKENAELKRSLEIMRNEIDLSKKMNSNL